MPLKIAEQLDALRRDFPDCRSVTFADLVSGLVLCASADRKLPQERLDALSGKARALLDGAAGGAASAALGAPPRSAVVSDGDRLLVFVRSPVLPDEAFCCDCARGIDLAAFTDRAARELTAIGGAGG